MNLMGDATLTTRVEDGSVITIRGGNLKILADVGDNVRINASQKLQIRGNVGMNCVLHAVDYIETHDVGDGTQLTSDVGKIRCHNLGSNVVIHAMKTVTVGSIPSSGVVVVRDGEICVGRDGGATLNCPGKIKKDSRILDKMMRDSNRAKS